jgi:transcriptional regulator with XRE-family HTH domain
MWIDRLIGDRMVERRTEHEITIENLSQRTGIAVSLLTAYEAGRTRIQRRDLLKIAQALDVTVERFFDGAKLLPRRRFPLVSLVRETVRIAHPQ